MSSFDSVPKLSVKQKSAETDARLVNTNLALQKALQQLSAESRSSIILRCDELPFVYGNAPDLEAVFSWLLNTILEKKPCAAKLFLHINCATASEEAEATLKAALQPFIIHFTSNITPCTEWLHTNEAHVAEIAGILQKQGGSLIVNQLKNNGCIFSVTLFGKHL